MRDHIIDCVMYLFMKSLLCLYHVVEWDLSTTQGTKLIKIFIDRIILLRTRRVPGPVRKNNNACAEWITAF